MMMMMVAATYRSPTTRFTITIVFFLLLSTLFVFLSISYFRVAHARPHRHQPSTSTFSAAQWLALLFAIGVVAIAAAVVFLLVVDDYYLWFLSKCKSNKNGQSFTHNMHEHKAQHTLTHTYHVVIVCFFFPSFSSFFLFFYSFTCDNRKWFFIILHILFDECVSYKFKSKFSECRIASETANN